MKRRLSLHRFIAGNMYNYCNKICGDKVNRKMTSLSVRAAQIFCLLADEGLSFGVSYVVSC